MIKKELNKEYITFIENLLSLKYGIFEVVEFETVSTTVGWDGDFFMFQNNGKKYFLKIVKNVIYDSEKMFVEHVFFSYSIYSQILKLLPSNLPVQLSGLLNNKEGNFITPFLLPNSFEDSDESDESDEEEESYRVMVVLEYIDGVLLENDLNENHDKSIILFLKWIHKNSKIIIDNILKSNVSLKIHNSSRSVEIKIFREVFDIQGVFNWMNHFFTKIENSKVLASSEFLKIKNVTSRAIDELKTLHCKLKEENLFDTHFVINHTDLHGWNLLLNNSIIFVVDWDFVKLGPIERDLSYFKNRKVVMNEFFKNGEGNLLFQYFCVMIDVYEMIDAFDRLCGMIRKKQEKNIEYFLIEIRGLVKRINKWLD